MVEITDTEKEKLNELLEDLKLIFSKEEIPYERVGDIVDELKTNEAKAYLNNLIKGSKPEQALREAFLAGRSILTKYLFKKIVPEVYEEESGFVDYMIEGEGDRFVLLELKSAFERDKKGLKLKKLKWEDHKKQITKYVREGSRFIILTNLKDWYFFSSKDCIAEETSTYFHESDLFTFYDKYDFGENLWNYLEREEFLSIREPLDKKFFTDLKKWVKLLSEVEVELDDKSKTESIIWLVNKFIFIQTLDDYGVIDFQWLRHNWDNEERRWSRKGKLQVLKEFLGLIDRWFYEYYDTELFMNNNLLKYIKKDERNIDKFYRHVQLVLGLTYMQTFMGGFRGIMQYNFRNVNEDILGKAYETFLAEIRKEQGIYYTPSYVTEYIVKNAVGVLFDNLIKEIKESLEKEDFKKATELVKKFTEIRVLDPACGSGSFLIKSIRLIWKKYQELNEILGGYNSVKKKEKQDSKGFDKYEDHKEIIELKRILSLGDNRLLISKMILRHIHGNDLDKKALDVAKVNIWLEAIKLSPKDFRWQTLPSETNHILPNLEMNFGNGDSLVGLPEKETIEYLQNNHKEELIKLFELRNKYLEDPTDPDLVMEIEGILFELRKELIKVFNKYLKENQIDTDFLTKTKPFHWALDFWYLFFNEQGLKLEEKSKGFSEVVGNPPYVSTYQMKWIQDYLKKEYPDIYSGHDDISYYFIHKGLNLLKQRGNISYIALRYFLESIGAKKLRDSITNSAEVLELIDTQNNQLFGIDVNVLTVIFLFRKGQGKELCDGIKVVKKVKDPLYIFEILQKIKPKNQYSDDVLYKVKLTQDYLKTSEWYLTKEEDKKIVSKIREKCFQLGSKFKIGQGMICGCKSIFGIPEEEAKALRLEKETIRNLVITEDIKPYMINNKEKKLIYTVPFTNLDNFPNTKKYLENNKDKLTARYDYDDKKYPWFGYQRVQNQDLYEKAQPKIITPAYSTSNKFGWDDGSKKQNFIGMSDIYSIVPKEGVKIDLKYILAILNSKLGEFYHKRNSKLKRDDYYEYISKPLSKFPIKDITSDKEIYKELQNLADKIIMFKKVITAYINILKVVPIQLKNYEYTFDHILANDLRETRDGNFKNAWTSKVSCYPNEKNDDKLKQEYAKFKIKQNSENNSIKVHGLKEDGNYEEVYDMIFTKKELMQLIYFVLHTAISSRSRIKNLDSLFKKATVPVIQPNIVQNTPNIIKKIEQEFKEWLKKEGIKEKIPVDLGEIEKQIQDTDNLIDAYVFKLYDLNKEEIVTVLDSLKVEGDIREDILKKFEGIKK